LAGNLDEAAKWLAQALAAGGDTAPEAGHWLAKTLLKQKKYDEAQKIATQVLPQAGDGPFAANLLFDQAEALYYQEGKRKDSVAAYGAVAQKFPQHAVAPQALYSSAFTLLGLGDNAAALAGANAFLKAYPSDPLVPEVKVVAAEADLQLNQFAEAEKLYDELLAGQPSHADADQWKVRRALALNLQKKYADVIKALEPIASKLKTPDLIAQADYLIGSSQFELHQYDAAAKSLQASLAAQPKWAQADDTLLALAATERQLNKPAEAIATVRKMLAEFPQSKQLDRAHFRLAEFALAAGDNKLAASEYQQVIEKWPASPLTPNAWHGLGWAELIGKNYQQSVDTLTKLIDKFPDNPLVPRARYHRGMARQQLKQFDAGIEDVQAFLKSNPPAAEKADALYVEGLCDVGLQKYGPAIEIFRNILKDDPKYAGADKVLYELAWALKSENKDAEATEAFARLTKEFVDSPLTSEAQFHVGESYYQNKDYAKAAEAYFAAEKKPGTPELGEKAAHKLAWAYYQQGQYEKAQQGFDYQLSKYPQGELAADALFMAAESLFKQNKYELAAAAYQKSLAKLPANKDLQVLADLHAGQSLTHQQKWDAGLKVLTAAAKDFPDSPYMAEIEYEQGWALQNLGKTDEAFKQYEEATALSDGLVGARARFMMGEILFEKKDYKEAARNFFKVAYGYGYPQAPEPIQKWQANSAYEAARCFEVLKMTAQAKKSYQEVVDKYPNSDKAPLAKTRLGAL
jgi:TolA-binding protein